MKPKEAKRADDLSSAKTLNPKTEKSSGSRTAVALRPSLQSDQSLDSQNDQVFPSQTSEFSFQPKYFKPQKAGPNSSVVNDLSNGSLALSARLLDSSSTQKTAKDRGLH